jgi:hypothetical protein
LKPISAAELSRLARHPSAMARYLSTGQLPKSSPAPSSALIELLHKIPPRLRAAMVGFSVGPELGYCGLRSFHTAAQAMLWLLPPGDHASHPAESWRDKRFHQRLWLDDVLACCASYPPSLATDFAHLMDPERKPGANIEPAADHAPKAPQPGAGSPGPARRP